MRIRLSLICCLLAVFAPPADALDLLERYPTKLIAGDMKPDRARVWEFGATDVFRLSQFRFECGRDLKIETGPANLGVGHCEDGGVWAVVIPQSGGMLFHQGTNKEAISHIWLRYHPREVNRLFPPETVFADGATNLAAQIRAISNVKFYASFHSGDRAIIPEPNQMTVDVDTKEGPRRFFMVDTAARTAEYVDAFEKLLVKPPPAITTALAEEAFDQMWKAFDRDYAMFVLRPELDWARLREQDRPQALASKSTPEFAEVCADMLKNLRDLHIWMTVAGANVPVFNRPRMANSNPNAHKGILGDLESAGSVQWGVTKDKIGFIAIYGWNSPDVPVKCNQALEQMRNTRGLIVDVRLNGGGSEPLAQQFASRFLAKEFVYAYHQLRNGASHTNLTEKKARTVMPKGPWRYDRPVVLLIGEKCMSSNESFIGMMTGDPEVTTMGDHTCGSSGNPKIVRLPLEMTVSVPRWVDYLPDGTPLDERGFQPQIRFEPKPGAFEGARDDLLATALERLRQAPLPDKAIEGPVFDPDEGGEAAAMKEEARDTSRPRVISVTPANDATVDATVRELRVRFDRPMEPLSLKLNWMSGGFTSCDFPKYDPEKCEFILPIRLVPGTQHKIILNRVYDPEKIVEERQQSPYDGFQSTDRRLAGLFVWRFSTQAVTPTEARPAKAIRVVPASGSEVPRLTFVELQFDQPMAPPEDTVPTLVDQSGERPSRLRSAAILHAKYDAAKLSYRLPLLMPSKTNVSFTLTGFRNADGVPADPIPINYRVMEDNIATTNRAKAEADARDPQLLALLEAMQVKRAQLKSIAERCQTFQVSKDIDRYVFTHLYSQGTSFQWQSPDRFYGDVSERMNYAAFRIGSDGQNWWWHTAKSLPGLQKLTVCPVTEMQKQYISLCDPFELTQKTSAQAAADLGLRLVGSNNKQNSTIHLLEASVRDGQMMQWQIDAQTLRPVEVAKFYRNSVMRYRFYYDVVNELLPPEAFAVPKPEGVTPSPAEVLDANYTNRFINLRDGSDGSVSVRWGKEGPKGSRSGGLN